MSSHGGRRLHMYIHKESEVNKEATRGQPEQTFSDIQQPPPVGLISGQKEYQPLGR